jgi:hypothetical protein
MSCVYLSIHNIETPHFPKPFHFDPVWPMETEIIFILGVDFEILFSFIFITGENSSLYLFSVESYSRRRYRTRFKIPHYHGIRFRCNNIV